MCACYLLSVILMCIFNLYMYKYILVLYLRRDVSVQNGVHTSGSVLVRARSERDVPFSIAKIRNWVFRNVRDARAFYLHISLDSKRGWGKYRFIDRVISSVRGEENVRDFPGKLCRLGKQLLRLVAVESEIDDFHFISSWWDEFIVFFLIVFLVLWSHVMTKLNRNF